MNYSYYYSLLYFLPDLLIFMIIVDGIINVKSMYRIKRNWQGDPCTPLAYLWEGLNCSYAESGSAKIVSL